MDKFRKVFRNKHVVLPVIHVDNPRQTNWNIALAKEAGADGVFLINHKISCEMLLDVYQLAAHKFPDFWIGINLLGEGPFSAFYAIFNKGLRVSGVWTDNALIEEYKPATDQRSALKVWQRILEENWKGLYFGGVAFKYQREVENLERASWIASQFMHVVTTSGEGTGIAAEIEKIKRIRRAIPGKPLAVASGITPENVREYLIADCFLVSTGISRDFYNLDDGKTKKLIETVRQ